MNISRPHFCCVIFVIIIRILKENSKLLACIHSNVIIHRYSHIQQRHKTQILTLHEVVDLSGGMGALVDCEDHLFVHVFEIGPEDVERDVVLVVFADYLADLRDGFVAPTALMVSKTPKGRNVTSADIFMITL